jgi:hypothetical protein
MRYKVVAEIPKQAWNDVGFVAVLKRGMHRPLRLSWAWSAWLLGQLLALLRCPQVIVSSGGDWDINMAEESGLAVTNDAALANHHQIYIQNTCDPTR